MDETNDQSNTSNDTGKETDNTSKETKPLSIVEEARGIRDEIVKAKDELKTEREKLEKVQSEALLSGTAGGHIETKPAAEETPKEYRARIEKEVSEGKYN